MASEEQVGVINLGGGEIDPKDVEGYREKIARAKAGLPLSALKGNTPLGGVEKPQMPILRPGSPPIQRGDFPDVPASAQGVAPRPPGSPVLRPETKQQLDAAIAAGKKLEAEAQQKVELDEKKLAEDARLEKIFESFDFVDQQRQVEHILDNKKRRKEIEERCKTMQFDDLLMKDEVDQVVPVLPGKFEPRFRSLRPIETLYLKARMAKESVQTDQYLGEKYNLLLLTCSLIDINGRPLPDHRRMKADGTFEVDDKLFDEKLAALMNKSGYIIADLGVNYAWFDIRVRRLLNPDDLKNG